MSSAHITSNVARKVQWQLQLTFQELITCQTNALVYFLWLAMISVKVTFLLT
ncbi:hypothetical protein [Clostridium acidisoli]|uniref:hypothetical protein n=1 Tax=Clostridium acidisoli TaxID=91624 RepID=UPI0015937E6A|nr:hypothetical protein [Clostridium acidisoli]